MKTVYKWLESVLYFTMLVLLSSCAATQQYIPNDSTIGDLSVEQARKVLTRKINTNVIRLVDIDGYRGYWVTRIYTSSFRMIVTDERGIDTIFIFSKIPDISLGEKRRVEFAGRPIFYVYDDHVSFVNALYVLKQNAVMVENNSKEDGASFAASLPDYRQKAALNADLPEEAVRFKVQGEGAVRDKEFDAAADFYGKALKIVPWWPAGHFNRALVLGETGDYEMAMREMKHYLQLVPDAPNGRAAQDKIYDWERLAAR